MLQAATSPTKSLIEKYNTGVVRSEESPGHHSQLGRASHTKLMINKWNNPEKLNKAPPTGGFQVLRRDKARSGRNLIGSNLMVNLQFTTREIFLFQLKIPHSLCTMQLFRFNLLLKPINGQIWPNGAEKQLSTVNVVMVVVGRGQTPIQLLFFALAWVLEEQSLSISQ